MIIFLLTLVSCLTFSQAFVLQRFSPIVTRNRVQTQLKNSLLPQINKLIERKDLTIDETEEAWDKILTASDPIPVGVLLALLRSKGETPKEIAGMVKSMKKACIPVSYSGRLLDIVGTGGDGADTINISTASVILAAACGCKVAKAGNRSVSSRCGSADVLEKLGIKLEMPPKQVLESIQSCGIGFLFAPIFHPAMKKVAPIRKAMGIRTAFNILGPLTNAASADRVIIGVFKEELVDLLANTLMELGHVDHGMVIHGCGLDEISPLGSSTIFEIKAIGMENGKKIYSKNKYLFDPQTINIPRCKIEDLKGGDADENAQALRDVLSGGNFSNAKRDSILLNAGVGVYVYGLASSIEEGVQVARDVLYSGKAIDKLNEWISTSQKIYSQLN